METSWSNYPEILKYGAVLNMLRIKSKGTTILRANESIKIKIKCAVNFGLEKLTIEKMEIRRKIPGRQS